MDAVTLLAGLRQRGVRVQLLPEDHFAVEPASVIDGPLRDSLRAHKHEILLALVDGDHHGYAIMKEVDERTAGRVKLRPGTLYRAVSRLLEDTLIQESEMRPDPAEDDERRRYYRLTSLGRSVAAAEAKRMETLVHSAYSKALIEGSGGR